MDKIMHGVVQGNAIQLSEPPGLPDGQEVQVVVVPVTPEKRWGEGILASAGGWADYPEMDAIMEEIQEDRKRERRPQVPE